MMVQAGELAADVTCASASMIGSTDGGSRGSGGIQNVLDRLGRQR